MFRNSQKRSRFDSEIGRLGMMSSHVKNKKKKKSAGDNGASLSPSLQLNI